MTETTENNDDPDLRLNRILILVQSGVLGFAGMGLSVYVLKLYGTGLFVFLPFAIGFLSTVLASVEGPVSIGGTIGRAVLAIVGVALMFFLFGFEGAICLLFIFPLWLPGAIAGAIVGVWAVRWARGKGGRAVMVLAMVGLAPTVMGLEWVVRARPPLLKVTTTVEIDATPDRVWRNVIAFDPLPEPREWLFRAGVAYPVRAEILGSGVGAERHCVFSTGAFVEPITAWEEERLLAFDVTNNPQPMREMSFYGDLDAPHLHGYFASERGQFRLIDLGGGRMRLEGTTWYRNDVAPRWYFRLWSDHIIHKIHRRVLGHIKSLAETGGAT